MKKDKYVTVWDLASKNMFDLADVIKLNKPNIKKESWQNNGKKRKPLIK